MIKLALLGKDIQHSRSQKVYEEILGKPIEYKLFDIDNIEDIPTLDVVFSHYQGLSITAPYKSFYIDDLALSEKVEKLGAVNCIKKLDSSYLGQNTDYQALKSIFESSYIKYLESFSITILGDGHMSYITREYLDDLGVSYQLRARSKGDDLQVLGLDKKKSNLIINTCSREFVFKGHGLDRKDIFWDYNYSMTKHANSLALFCDYRDGSELLKLQAQYALEFWGIE